MNNTKAIAFPNTINRPRLIGPIEIDTLITIFMAFFISFALGILILGFQAIVLVLFSIITTVATTFLYSFYKKNAKKGFLFHWLYVNNLFLPKYKGIEGLPSNFLPKGYECEFRD
ncbi:hypothetical protein BKH42_03530 [Helicobacter sp. 13S00482-2]|uniref:type IV conjugative transfer system protein TraL n=1 Tax=Helicobacter sp. 13S00482-2 TaxID=1476200 RepID=UPI000BA536EE|nr:hypothetical protein [Helicobacter sp. 13S00482-2]PAF53812.1 hypothetical protein BKH42_03530 [Helicobacter sp. 13S00482-2]